MIVAIRASQPQFSEEIHIAKHAAARQWRNTGLTVHKEIYLNARTHYNGLLDAAKKHPTTITKSLGLADIKAIHGMMNDTLKRTKECKLPAHTSSSALAKGCSLDPMPTWMVKGATEETLASIKDIVNVSMSAGEVPKSLKMAIISPLLKKLSPDPEVLSNY